jgi:hypothetical protein
MPFFELDCVGFENAPRLLCLVPQGLCVRKELQKQQFIFFETAFIVLSAASIAHVSNACFLTLRHCGNLRRSVFVCPSFV